MISLMDPKRSSADFPSTRWTLVRQLREEPARKDAMEAICQQYWLPVYAFLRQRGTTPAEAEDLTQTFFARLLSAEALEALSEENGKLRSYLLKALQNHQIDEWRREKAQRRKGATPRRSSPDRLARSGVGRRSPSQPRHGWGTRRCVF